MTLAAFIGFLVHLIRLLDNRSFVVLHVVLRVHVKIITLGLDSSIFGLDANLYVIPLSMSQIQTSLIASGFSASYTFQFRAASDS